jgi:DNA polymerase III subunit epsilon
MLRNLALERPLAVIDLETTGTDTQNDRIVELSVLKIMPDGQRIHRTHRLNPGIPIPEAATEVHGIRDAGVTDKPRFAQIAGSLVKFLNDCDLGGFNLKRFDLRLLLGEFQRARVHFALEGRALIDALEIFHAYEHRDLTTAVRFYFDREHDGAHGAGADVLATAEVLDAMVARYVDLPRTIDGLNHHFRDPAAVDIDECFTRVKGDIRFSIGRFRGQPLDAVARTNPDYLEWILRQSFFDDTKSIVRDAIQRNQ